MIAIHSVLLVTLLKITRAGAETRTCGPMPRLPAPLYRNMRVRNNEVTVLDGIDLERCALECYLVSRRVRDNEVSFLNGIDLERCVLECFLISKCASLNYVYISASLRRCELNWATAASVGVRLENFTRYVYYDFAQWTHFHALAGSCASRPCDENQRCIPTTPYTCADVDCGSPPSYTLSEPPWLFHVTPRRGMTSLGSHRGYTCNNRWAYDGFVAQELGFRDVGYTICSSNSRWTILVKKCFSYITTCQEVQACNPGSPDGHYHVYPTLGVFSRAVIVYCRNMTTSTPYMEDALPDATPDDVIEHACATDPDV